MVAGGGGSVTTYAVEAGAGCSTTVRSLRTVQALRPASMAIVAIMTRFMAFSFGLGVNDGMRARLRVISGRGLPIVN